MATPYRSLYLTFPDSETAVRIARALLEARLVACVNVLRGARSLYWWEGSVHDEAEVVAVAKSREDLVAAVAALVRELHPYDTPCIVAWPVADGDAGYLAWIDEALAG
jgi:periplasmic divalent cation tolerance protein